MNKIQPSVAYMPQLDSLRAFAVLCVIIFHWFSKEHFFNRYSDNGIIGVTLFFVLSGYLITKILLRNKDAVGASLKNIFRNFYIRRSIRIFPIYYLLLFLLLILNVYDISTSFFWHFFYASNFYFWSKGMFEGPFSHFWTLAVEEQFYLFWPAIILLLPTLRLPLLFLAGILSAIIFRIRMSLIGDSMGHILLPGSLDSFCLGALLAYGQLYRPGWFKIVEKHRNKFLVILFSAFVVIQAFFRYKWGDWLYRSLYFTILSIFFVQLIYVCSVGVKRGPFVYLLNNRFVIYLGKISYGLYLYHNVIPYFYHLRLPIFGDNVPDAVIQSMRFIILFGLASLSWHFFERPILAFKNKSSLSLKSTLMKA